VLLGHWLVWEIGKGFRVRIGEDPWMGCKGNYRFSNSLSNPRIISFAYAMNPGANSS
jgi:hypothetical protein